MRNSAGNGWYGKVTGEQTFFKRRTNHVGTLFDPRPGPLTGQRLAAFGAERKYTTIVEPNEKAFSCLLPDGWTTKGGMVRPSLVSVNIDMTGASADGKVTTLATNVFPAYIEPAWGGYPVGTRYSLGFGAIGEVQPYTPAADFIKKGILPKRVGKFKVTRVVDRKDLLKGPALPGTTAAHAAEVEYTFERDGKPYVGGMLCITGAMSDGTFTYWHVDRLVGYEAPKDRVEEGKAALALADVTLRWNPIWVKAEAKGAADRRKIIEGLLEYKSEAISTAYWNRAGRWIRSSSGLTTLSRARSTCTTPARDASCTTRTTSRITTSSTIAATWSATTPALRRAWTSDG